jgi:hypothetical protein
MLKEGIVVAPRPLFFFGLVHFFHATNGLLLALQSEFRHIQCLLALSKFSRIAIGTAAEHIVGGKRREN